jgi:DNA-directed RNA polymerase specialized sigma24 family protein
VDDLGKLIGAVNAGLPGAQDALFASAYGDLRKLARSRLRDGGRSTMLDTTALVHESYLRFLSSGPLRSDDRRAFFAYASRVMRSVIIDSVRERSSIGHQPAATRCSGIARNSCLRSA